MMTRPMLISAIEAVTRPLQQNITTLTWKIDNLTEMVKDDIHKKKMDGILQELEAVKSKICNYEKMLQDAGLHNKAK